MFLLLAFAALIARFWKPLLLIAALLFVTVGFGILRLGAQSPAMWFLDCKQMVDERLEISFGYEAWSEESFETAIFSPQGGTEAVTDLPLQLTTETGKHWFTAYLVPDDTGLQYMGLFTDQDGFTAMMPIESWNIRWCDDERIVPTYEPEPTQPAPIWTPEPTVTVNGPWDCEDWQAYDPQWNRCYDYEPNADGTIPLPPVS